MDLGILSYVFGEIWWAILPHLARERGATSREEGLIVLKKRLQVFYKENKVDSKIPMKRLKLRTVKSKKPKLKARAAQARRLVPFTLALANEFQNTDGELGRHTMEAMQSLATIFELASKRQLRQDELTKWRWLAAKHMFHYVSCGFATYPKHHYFLHLPEQVERGGVPRTVTLQRAPEQSKRQNHSKPRRNKEPNRAKPKPKISRTACHPHHACRTSWVYSDESKNSQAKQLWAAVSKGHNVCQLIILRLEWLKVLQKFGEK